MALLGRVRIDARVVAVAAFASGCAPQTSTTAEEVSGTGVTLPPGGTTTSADATDDVPATDTSADDATTAGDDGGCGIHPDCGDLECSDDRCTGCSFNAQCPEDEVCVDDTCVPFDDAPTCRAFDGPTCGDGIVGPLEECDGASGCDRCRDDAEPQPWFSLERLDDVIVSPDGAAFAVNSVYSGQLWRFAQNGALEWSVEYEQEGGSIAVDGEGMVYVAGSNLIPVADARAPWVASWAPDGAPRWSTEGTSPGSYRTVAVDANRIIAAGVVPLDNSPQVRGLIAQYDTTGAPQWSEMIATVQVVSSVAIIGSEVAAAGVAVHPWWRRTLMRIDDTGSVRWSVDVSVADGGYDYYSPWGMTHDGSGGTWVWGEKDGGPWAVRHDADGEEIDRLECFAGASGRITDLEIGPRGQLAIGVLVTGGPVPIGSSMPWLAIVDAGVIRSGVLFGEDAETLRMFSLGWFPDGRVAAGIDDHDQDEFRVMLVE